MNLTQFRKLIQEEISKALSEVSIPANVAQFSKKKGATAIVKKVAGWAEKAGKKIVNGRAIGKNYNTLILDLTTNGSEIYINLEDGVIKLFGKPVTDASSFTKVLHDKEVKEEIRLVEKGRTGLPGQVEKDINIALRNNYKEDNINYGGCGAMAKLLYYACKKHLGITPKIVCLLATYKFLEKNAKSVNLSNVDSLVDLNDEGLSLIHIIVQIPGTNVCLDSDGFHSLDWFMKTYYNKCLPPESQKIATMVSNDSVSIQMLSKWVNQSFNWNRTFSRGRIPDLAKEVEELMSKAAKIPAIQSVVRTNVQN
jgi:hypothetical protein